MRLILAQDIFLKLNGIAGESQDTIHKDQIEVIQWSWAANQPANMHLGSGGGAAKSTIENLQFDHYIDKASPNLLHCCLSGKHIAEAILTVRKAGGSPLEYLKIMLQQVIITKVNSTCYYTMRAPRETVELSFAHIKLDYQQQSAQARWPRCGAIIWLRY